MSTAYGPRIAVALCTPLLLVAAGSTSYTVLARSPLRAGATISHVDSIPSRLRPLTVLAGTWKTDGRRYATDYSSAGRDSSVLRNDCWGSGAFYACDQIIDGKSTALIVFSAGKAPGTFSNYSLPAAGGPAGFGLLTISGTSWDWGPAPGDTVGTRWHTTNTFTTPTTIRFKVQFSHDGQHWTTMSEGVERKIRE